MPRPATSTTRRIDEFNTIDLVWLRRQGARTIGHTGQLTWRRNGQVHGSIGYALEATGLRLRYWHTPYGGAPESIDEVIPIVTTTQHLGGDRHWFACPSCRRRCRIIYGGSRFRFRLCQGAYYRSQYQHAALSICDQRWAIRRRLEERGGAPWGWSLDDGFPPKPKGMWWRTYRKLKVLDERLAGRWSIGMSGFLERLDRRTRRR